MDDKEKIVTYEMFKKYHELLIEYIAERDGLNYAEELQKIVDSDEEIEEEVDIKEWLWTSRILFN